MNPHLNMVFAAIWMLVMSTAQLHMDLYDEVNSDLEHSLNDLEAFRVMDPHSQCLRIALTEIIHQCRDNGLQSLTSTDRKYLALKLTICEMESFKLTPPMTCNNLYDEGQIDQCIVSIEKIPQYWTMFSGNYRDIRKICHEESIPHEKDEILNLYGNITKVFIHLNSEVARSSVVSDKFVKDFQGKLSMLLDSMKHLSTDVNGIHKHLSDEVKESEMVIKDTFKEALDLLLSLKTQTADDFNEIAVNVNFLNLELRNLQETFQDINIPELMISLKESVSEECEEIIDVVGIAVDQVKKKLDDLNNQLGYRDELDLEVHQQLVENIKLSQQVNQLFHQIEFNALQQYLSLTTSQDDISSFLNQLLNGLEHLFGDIDSKLHSYLLSVGKETSKTLSKLQEANQEVDSLLSHFRVGRNIISSIRRVFLVEIPKKGQAAMVKLYKTAGALQNLYNKGVAIISFVNILLCLLVIWFINYRRTRSIRRVKLHKSKSSMFSSRIIIPVILLIIMALLVLTIQILVDLDHHYYGDKRYIYSNQNQEVITSVN